MRNTLRHVCAATLAAAALGVALAPGASADCVPQRVETPPLGLGVCYALDDNCALVRVYSRTLVTNAATTDVKHCL